MNTNSLILMCTCTIMAQVQGQDRLASVAMVLTIILFLVTRSMASRSK